MRSGDRCYIDQVSISQLPGLEHDCDFEALSPPDLKAVILWMGASTRSGLHFDLVDNLFAQIYGTKLAILAAPQELCNLHLFPDSHTKSQVAPEHPDLEAHPHFARATLVEGVLEPGDVIYLPRAWWHYFASSESSISLALLARRVSRNRLPFRGVVPHAQPHGVGAACPRFRPLCLTGAPAEPALQPAIHR